MNKQAFFEGWYYKLHKENFTIVFIPGIAQDMPFIQIITNENTFYIPYKKDDFKVTNKVVIGNNLFSHLGLQVDIETDTIKIKGRVTFHRMTPLNYDIMGPFSKLPMECRHGVLSMHHRLKGSLTVNNKVIDLTNGTGYCEKDSGISFPKTYLWLQCNDFSKKASIMVSIADIPFLGFTFKGCIAVLYFNNTEYRFATYLGVKILHYSKTHIVLKQGCYQLEIHGNPAQGHKLAAPTNGKMERTIYETLSCSAYFRFYKKGKLLFDEHSSYTSFEFVE
ncbi:MAG: tocopherol cyclase family protein [Oscillospiraceae bacterium]